MGEWYFSWMAERDKQCPDPCWSPSGPLCILLLGGVGLLGLDRLKSALLALGLKCGGTLEERAQRLFSTKGKSLESLDTSLFAKNPKTKGTKRDTERNKDIAFLEAQIYEYVEILGEQRHLTHENVQRKQARTGEEREEEEEEQISESESEDEENEIIYNPKTCPWAGTANLFLTGCISFMA